LRAWFDEDWKCLDYLDWLRWPDGFTCPGCGASNGWRASDRQWRCAGCDRRVSATAGTILRHHRRVHPSPAGLTRGRAGTRPGRRRARLGRAREAERHTAIASRLTGLLSDLGEDPEPDNAGRGRCTSWLVHITSVVAFAFTHLLGYAVLPRLKNIGAARLYLPDPDLAPELPHLGSVLTRPIRCARLA